MGKPATLLEQLCGHVLAFDTYSIEVEHKDGQEIVFMPIDGVLTRIANFSSDSADGKELRANLSAAAKKPVRAILRGQIYILNICALEKPDADAFAVSIDPAPKLDPSVLPSFSARQGQYLAFIHEYSKIHRYAPAESDLERYFRVSGPAIHDMIVTLHRNGFIDRTPGQTRSIRVLVNPEHIPRLK